MVTRETSADVRRGSRRAELFHREVTRETSAIAKIRPARSGRTAERSNAALDPDRHLRSTPTPELHGARLARASRDSPNVRPVATRTDTLGTQEREPWKVATARASSPCPALAPAVRDGTPVEWRARHERGEADRTTIASASASAWLGWVPGPAVTQPPFPGVRHPQAFPKVAPPAARFLGRTGHSSRQPLS